MWVNILIPHMDPSWVSNLIVVGPPLPPKRSAQAVDAQVFAETPSAGLLKLAVWLGFPS